MNQVIKSSLVAFVLSSTSMLSFSQNNQKSGDLPHGWHLLDKTKDGYNGISINQAYDFVKSKGLKSNPVLVAVIDSGVDTLHEDLKSVLWNNPNEIPGNGIDDDHNGYVDDVHGWNFIGGKDGKNVKQDSYEGARVYHALKEKYTSSGIDTAALQGDSLEEYKTWLKAKKKVEGDGSENGLDLGMLKKALGSAQKSDSILRKALNKDTFTGNTIDTFQASTPTEKAAKGGMVYLFRANQMMETTNVEFLQGFGEFVDGEERKAEAKEKAPPNYRKDIVGDNESDINDRYYGNSDVMSGTPFHGTHVSGIIGATRNNNVGMDGIADNVKIMMVRAVPDGDEHDKDIALAIRYAVDNGAKVINMSFGKDFSPEKKWVDSAVKYAQLKGVLLVHAAGNDAKNIDTADNFPNNKLRQWNTEATNWITVGASGDENTGGITAPFSNYGKEQVDVFAPGVKIYSTIPGGNTYGNAQGTSMACPVVVGTAAFLLEYFPTLTPEQLKYCIEKSAQTPANKVKKPGSDDMVSLTEISKSGGVINAYEAAKVAAGLKPENNKSRKSKRAPKTRMTNVPG
ncbi:MAG: S8 family serine peptidase [Chitinophagaceae bacterium]|nr:S8 family serine peptidase [Chitinophagaceae bacterium]